MSEHMACTASVWPHRHTDELTGPLDVKISYRNQPIVVTDWANWKDVWASIEQPDERTNFTVLGLYFGYLDEEHVQTRIRQCSIGRDGTIKFYIKARITRRMEHPIPRGKWKGTCEYTDRWCRFTFQAMTMRVQPKEEPRIILPDGSLPVKSGRIVLP
jgi:hypothetical protein